ncbi:MAG: riboflavin kinase, partial [Holophagaceae bacterium]
SGTVIKGYMRGQSLGFPTANLKTDSRLLPQSGVYITSVRSSLWEGEQLGLTNVGVQPTFHEGSLTVETHCPGGSGDWYGAQLKLDFLHRLRDEQKFNSSEELRLQIKKDITQGIQWWTQAGH